MERRIEELYDDLIETKTQLLEEIDTELCLIGELATIESAPAEQHRMDTTYNLKLRMQLQNMSEQYINDIDIEMELIASYLELEEKVNQLKRFIDDEVMKDLKYKKQYEDLANSKLGKIQRFWWRKRNKTQ